MSRRQRPIGQKQDDNKKRVAFVDIDGTLVLKDGSFNQALIDHLKKTYDEVYLCTQRCPATTVMQLSLPDPSHPTQYLTQLLLDHLQQQHLKVQDIAFGLSHSPAYSEVNTPDYLDVEQRLHHEKQNNPDRPIDIKKIDFKPFISVTVENPDFINQWQKLQEEVPRNKDRSIEHLIKKHELQNAHITFFDDNLDNCTESKSEFPGISIFNVDKKSGNIASVASPDTRKEELLFQPASYDLHHTLAADFLQQHDTPIGDIPPPIHGNLGAATIEFQPHDDARAPLTDSEEDGEKETKCSLEQPLIAGHSQKTVLKVWQNGMIAVLKGPDDKFQTPPDYNQLHPFTRSEIANLQDIENCIDTVDDREGELIPFRALAGKITATDFVSLMNAANRFTKQLMHNALLKYRQHRRENFLEIMCRKDPRLKDFIEKGYPLHCAFNSENLLDMGLPLTHPPTRDTILEPILQNIYKNIADDAAIAEIQFILQYRASLQHKLVGLKNIQDSLINPQNQEYNINRNLLNNNSNENLSRFGFAVKCQVPFDLGMLPKSNRSMIHLAPLPPAYAPQTGQVDRPQPLVSYFPAPRPHLENRSTGLWLAGGITLGLVTAAAVCIAVPPVGIAALTTLGIMSTGATTLPLAATIASITTAATCFFGAIGSFFKRKSNLNKNKQAKKFNESERLQHVKKHYKELEGNIIKPISDEQKDTLSSDDIVMLAQKTVELQAGNVAQATAQLKRILDVKTVDRLLFSLNDHRGREEKQSVGAASKEEGRSENELGLRQWGFVNKMPTDRMGPRARAVAHIYLASPSLAKQIDMLNHRRMLKCLAGFIRHVMIKSDNTKEDIELCNTLLQDTKLVDALSQASMEDNLPHQQGVTSQLITSTYVYREAELKQFPVSPQNGLHSNTIGTWKRIQQTNFLHIQEDLNNPIETPLTPTHQALLRNALISNNDNIRMLAVSTISKLIGAERISWNDLHSLNKLLNHPPANAILDLHHSDIWTQLHAKQMQLITKERIENHLHLDDTHTKAIIVALKSHYPQSTQQASKLLLQALRADHTKQSALNILAGYNVSNKILTLAEAGMPEAKEILDLSTQQATTDFTQAENTPTTTNYKHIIGLALSSGDEGVFTQACTALCACHNLSFFKEIESRTDCFTKRSNPRYALFQPVEEHIKGLKKEEKEEKEKKEEEHTRLGPE